MVLRFYCIITVIARLVRAIQNPLKRLASPIKSGNNIGVIVYL